MDMPFQKSEHPYQIFFEYLLNGRNYKGKSFLIWERPELQRKELKNFVDPPTVLGDIILICNY